MGKVISLHEKVRVENLPEDFLWFWSEYPRKEKKGDAYKAWNQTQGIRPVTEEVIAAVCKYAEVSKFRDRQFILLPASWLRAWSWTDE